MLRPITGLSCGLGLALVGCGAVSKPNTTPSPEVAEAPAEAQAPTLAAEWSGPYGGVPPWDQVEPSEFVSAFEYAMDAQRAEWKAIVDTSEAATFDNTIVALEKAGAELRRVEAIFGVYTSTLNTGEIPEIERTLAPVLAAFRDEYIQNAPLFKRVAKVYEARDSSDLSAQQKRLVDDYYKEFVRSGASLTDEPKARLSAINKRLAELYTNFSQNVLADETQYVLYLTKPEELEGLPEWLRDTAAQSAKERDHEGQWAVVNTRSSMEPFLTYSARRDLREKVWRSYYGRGDNGDERDNNAGIAEILALRAERAALLGYDSHAHWMLERQMAKKPAAAMDLLMAVWKPAVARAKEEVAEMQAIADKEGAKITIEAWDYRYYAEKLRKAKYDLDMNEVKPYMQLEKLREGMMWSASKIFGLNFEQVTDVPVYHEDVRVWKVTSNDGKLAGLWFFDPYARPGKHSGAWMNSYRRQHSLGGELVVPIVSNNSNFVKGAEGEAVLISWNDAQTLFHEFGHALHGLLSNVTYPSQSGTSVARDYVEFPSQLYEHWLSTKQVLDGFAVHHETGAALPADLLAKIEKARTFRQGFDTVEYLASALVDMKLHTADKHPIDPDAFEKEALKELGMPGEIVMRHRTPHFGHIFAGEGYAAGYYSYLWADTLTADAAEAFEEAGSFFDADVAKRLREHVLSVGDTVDPADGFRAFRGRDVKTEALMRKRGFPVAASN